MSNSSLNKLVSQISEIQAVIICLKFLGWTLCHKRQIRIFVYSNELWSLTIFHLQILKYHIFIGSSDDLSFFTKKLYNLKGYFSLAVITKY